MFSSLAAMLAGFLVMMAPFFATTLRLLRAWRRDGVLSPVGTRVAAGNVFVSLLVGGMTTAMLLSSKPVHVMEVLLGMVDILVVTFVSGAWTIFFLISEINKNNDNA